MIYTNTLMEHIISLECNKNEILSAPLLSLITQGFRNIDDCIFFEFQISNNTIYDINSNHIHEQFIDLSGYEISMNRFHIDDYVENSSIFSQSFLFLKEFKNQ